MDEWKREMEEDGYEEPADTIVDVPEMSKRVGFLACSRRVFNVQR